MIALSGKSSVTAERNDSRIFEKSACRSVSISTNSYVVDTFRSGSRVGLSARYGAALVVKLVAIDVAGVQIVANGLEVTLRRSKTNQEGAGRLIGVPAGSNPVTCLVLRRLGDYSPQHLR